MTAAVDRLSWQEALFAERLNRFQLMRLGARAAEDAPRLAVLRNHAFETGAAVLAPFLAYAGLDLQPAYSDYDDSLALPGAPAAAVLVWMDFARLSGLDDAELVDWLMGRLSQVHAAAQAPLVVANAPDPDARSRRLNAALDAWAAEAPGAAVLRLDSIAAELGEAFFDPARAAASGTRYADPAVLRAVRTLGLELLPGLLAPPLKALALDLDNTLYAGVLGEDGAEGVLLTPGHAELQAELARWAAQGMLLAVVSRNQPADVERLFAVRGDFPLKPEMVASWQVGWDDKSASVAAAAKAFNIAPDAILFVDDNAGELIEVGQAHPGLRLLFAGAAAERTAAALRLYPGLPRGGVVFAGRADDIRANQARQALAAEAADEGAYLRALQPVLTFTLDPADDLKRLAELSAKTNQFNLALRRFDAREVARRLADPASAVVHVRLADRLADSGSIAAIFMRREGADLVVEELCISCRALGRRLEGLIVAEAVSRAREALGAQGVAFDYASGPRNAPAREWLEGLVGGPLPGEAGRIEAQGLIAAARSNAAVRTTWTTPAGRAAANEKEAG